jgi:phospholipid/cholesterol/gamma-HCH transport system ATP-binding protein
MRTPLIEFRDVTKRFGDKTVLDKVNLKIYENEITTIIGKSGTGKTVLLKHIIGLLRPDEGTILFRGKPLAAMNRKEWREYKRGLSYLFQHNALFDSMTVFENVALPLVQTTSLTKSEIAERAMRRIEQTELGDAAHSYPAELSGGMQKRAALARALVTDPAVVLFDEPTTGQDPIRKNVILSMIAQYRRRFGFTAVLISHDIPDVFFVSDRLVLLWDGTVGFEGTYEEAMELSHPMIAEFVKSLEGLQDEVVGLPMKEAFRSCYTPLFSDEVLAPVTSAIRFTLDLDVGRAALGREDAAAAMNAVAAQVSHRLRQLGGFAVRYAGGDILAILPHTSIQEADQFIEGYAGEIKEQAAAALMRLAGEKPGPPSYSFDFRIKAGAALVSPEDDIDGIAGRAASGQRVIAVFQGGGKSEGQ